MILVIGLGNPGASYKHTYHNLGFEVVDEFAQKMDFPAFKKNEKLKALISEKGGVVLAKPQTFMNLSGKSALQLVKAYKPDSVILVHDEVDLPQGKIKVSESRSSAGHKGVESVMTYLKTNDLTRVRIGIQPEKGKPKDVEAFVLKKTRKEFLSAVLPLAVEEIVALLKNKEGS